MHSHQPERGREMGMKKMNLKQNVNELVNRELGRIVTSIPRQMQTLTMPVRQH